MRRREFLAGLGGVVAATAVRGAEAAKAEMGDGPIKLLFTGTGGLMAETYSRLFKLPAVVEIL